MKIFKYILFLLLIGIIGFCIYIATQPNEFSVERSRTMDVPAEIIYNNVIDFKNWEAWSSWVERDPETVITLSDKTNGVDGAFTWVDSHGNGSMKTLATQANQSIDQELQFGDFHPSKVHWSFEPTEDGKTKVTWDMKGEKAPFVFKASAALSGGFDNMIGPDFERGLEKLDSIMQIEKKNIVKPDFKLGDIVETELPAQKFIGYYIEASTEMSHEEMSKLYMTYMPKAGAYAATKLSDEDYVPGSLFTKWDEITQEAEFYIGLLVKKEVDLAEGMTALDLPAGNTIKISKYGNYGTGDYEAHTAIATYMTKKNMEQNGTTIWELYVNDPTNVKPEDVQTDIYYPVK